MKNFSDWYDYISSLSSQTINLGLERMKSVVASSRLHQFSCPVITVGGTNGKGSTVRFLEEIYRSAGYRVGAYTSPDLIRFHERIRINGEEIDEQTLIRAFEFIENIRHDQELTFFEFTTLAALWCFQQQALDVLILEVGLGGRLDAVNIVDANLAVIASIGIDHTDRLGPDREHIGYEKAGIFRYGKPVVYGDEDPPHSIIQKAHELQVPFYGLKRGAMGFHYAVAEQTWMWQCREIQYCNLPKPRLFIQNAATSLMVIQLLQHQLPVSRTALDCALQNATLPGRFEVLFEPVLCILDVAHNPSAAIWLAEQLKNHHPSSRTVAVVGMLKDKLIAETIAPMRNLIDAWYVAELTGPRGHDGSKIISYLRAYGEKSCYNSASVAAAMQVALTTCKKDKSRLVVFGSFHTVAEAKKYLSTI